MENKKTLMNETSLLSIEIGRGCNLANIHKKCPSGDSDRYGNLDTSYKITDDDIMVIISRAYSMGFQGQIAFHYYNEPLLYGDRVFRIIERTRELYPESKFFLNTNATYIDKYLDKLHYFKTINLSNYDGKDWSWLKEYLNPNTAFRVFDFGLDARKQNFQKYRDLKPCNRPYKEFIVDFYGNAHLCCMDWKGEIELGNVIKGDFETIFNKFVEYRNLVSGESMSEDAPEICKMCIGKTLNKTV